MMGMNMGTTPTMYQPNPVVGPMGSNTQFIPGKNKNHSKYWSFCTEIDHCVLLYD